MRVSEAKKLLKDLTQAYFDGAWVTFSRQSRAAKPDIPLVTLTCGNVKRPVHPINKMIDGVIVGHYLSRMSVQIDLFTHGRPVIDDDTGELVAYEDTAIDDMLAFMDFLDSEHAIEWCQFHDVSILVDGDAQDLTGLVNDNNYEFRSRITVLFYFTQTTVGHAAVLQETSVQYRTGEVEEETGHPVYTEEEPVPSTSTAGNPSQKDQDINDGASIIKPKFEQTTSGGGSEELAAEITSYFTKAEIKEEETNK